MIFSNTGILVAFDHMKPPIERNFDSFVYFIAKSYVKSTVENSRQYRPKGDITSL